MKQVLKQMKVNIIKMLHRDWIKEKIILIWNWILKIFSAVIGVIFVRSEADVRIEENRDHVRKLMLGIR